MSNVIKRVEFLIEDDYIKELNSFLNGKTRLSYDYEKEIEFEVGLDSEELSGSTKYSVLINISPDEFSTTPKAQILILISSNGKDDDIYYSIKNTNELDYVLHYRLDENYDFLISVKRDFEEKSLNDMNEYTSTLINRLIDDKNYCMGMVMKNSLSNKIECFYFLFSYITYMTAHKTFDMELYDYVQEKLSLNGYDEDFYDYLEFPVRVITTEEIISRLLYNTLSEVYSISYKSKQKYSISDLSAVANRFMLEYYREAM